MSLEKRESQKPNERPKIESIQVTTSPNGLPCIEIMHPTPEVRDLIKQAVLTQWSDDPAYQLKKDAGAFLQGDQPEWLMVEFWNKNKYQAFVEFLNEELSKLSSSN